MNIKIFAAAATLAMLPAQIHAVAFSRASSLPENVSAVYPNPDSRVDLGPNASPLGLQQISVMFKSDVTVNPDCSERACIYLEGSDTPIQTVGIAGVSVDLTQSKMGSVLFPNSCTANGRYRVTIPEGFWTLEGRGFNEALDLCYEILVPQRISPAQGVANELKEFRLEFPGYHEARLLNPRKIEFFRHSSPDNYPLTVSVGTNEDGSAANYILISLNEPVTEQGDYSLFVQKGAAEGVYYGASDRPEQAEETTDANIEALYHYTVSKLNTPAITPAEGIVETFVPFTLTVPEGAEFWFVNDRAVSFIYPVEEDGSLSPDAIYRLTATKDSDTEKIILTIIENGEPTASVAPQPGSYALQLASGLFSGSWNGEFINSAPFVYYYNVVDTPDGVKITPASAESGRLRGIFTIDGRKIQGIRKTDCTDNLPEGVYIIDGHKEYIRK